MLVVETMATRRMKGLQLEAIQLRLIVGTLLGDAHIVRTTQGYAYRANHGKEQGDYVRWKYEQLKSIVRTEPKLCNDRCWHFRTVSHPAMAEFRSRWYDGRRKKLCAQDLESWMDGFVLAVWIMDDGSRDKGQLRLNSQGFDRSENERLQWFLRAKLGIRTTLNRDKDRFRIRISDESMSDAVRLVKPHVVPSMLYKLPL